MTLEEQVLAWLRRSGLETTDVPGKLLPAENARTIEFLDIDGERLPEADVRRRFGKYGEDPKPKYLNPDDEPPHLYYPQVDDTDWRAHAKDVSALKIFAEGPIKAACVTKRCFPAIGVSGCWGWRSRGRVYLKEFDDYEWDGANVFWIPDRDRKPKSVADVLRASNVLGRVMQSLGAQFQIVWLPLLEGFKKVGIDDFLYYHSEGGETLGPSA